MPGLPDIFVLEVLKEVGDAEVIRDETIGSRDVELEVEGTKDLSADLEDLR